MPTELWWRGLTLSNGRGGRRRHVRLTTPSRLRTRIVCHDTEWVAECLDGLQDGLRALQQTNTRQVLEGVGLLV